MTLKNWIHVSPQGKQANENGSVTQYVAPRSDDASLPTLRLRAEHNFLQIGRVTPCLLAAVKSLSNTKTGLALVTMGTANNDYVRHKGRDRRKLTCLYAVTSEMEFMAAWLRTHRVLS